MGEARARSENADNSRRLLDARGLLHLLGAERIAGNVMGRPTKLTPKVKEAICNALAVGATRDMAAQYARIAKQTLYSWTGKGEAERERIRNGEAPNPDNKRYVVFLDALEDAEADAGITWLQVVDKEAQRDPNWAWKMLKVRFPSGFQEITRTELSGPDAGPIEVAVKGYSVVSPDSWEPKP